MEIMLLAGLVLLLVGSLSFADEAGAGAFETPIDDYDANRDGREGRVANALEDNEPSQDDDEDESEESEESEEDGSEASDEDGAGGDESDEPQSADTPPTSITAGHPDLALAARQMGVSDQEINQFQTPDEAYRALTILAKRQAEGEGPKTKDDVLPSFEFKTPELPDEEYGEEVRAFSGEVKKFGEHVNERFTAQQERFAQLENMVTGMQRQAEQSRQAQAIQRFDDAIGGLGEGWQEMFGSGPSRALGKDSEHFQNRLKVDRTVVALERGMLATGQPMPSYPQLFAMALGATFHQDQQRRARQELKAKVNGRAKQQTAAPAGRRKRRISERQAALAEIGKIRGSAGVPDDITWLDDR